jgi:TrmH family RNA methyltransferase
MIPSKPDIKLIRSLAKRKSREENGLFVVEGEKLVQEAVDSGWEIIKLFTIKEIGEEMMSRITLLSSPSPALAIVKIKEREPFELPSEESLCLALDSVKDPGNLGTIVRLAEWFGVDAIYCSEDCVDIFNPKCVQSTMGAIFRTKMIYTNLPDLIRTASAVTTVFGTFMEGDNIYTQKLPSGGLIVMGSESNGISKDVAKLIEKRITIPSFRKGTRGSESLNVAIATAVICSEFRRFSV